MREGKFQHDLVDKLESLFPGCIIFRANPVKKQGIPDLIILYNDRWAALECKKAKDAPHRPNQDYYVDLMNGLSFASFIYPENEEEVLNALQSALRAER